MALDSRGTTTLTIPSHLLGLDGRLVLDLGAVGKRVPLDAAGLGDDGRLDETEGGAKRLVDCGGKSENV